MSEAPLKSEGSPPNRKSPLARGLVWSGLVSLVLAAACFGVYVAIISRAAQSFPPSDSEVDVMAGQVASVTTLIDLAGKVAALTRLLFYAGAFLSVSGLVIHWIWGPPQES